MQIHVRVLYSAISLRRISYGIAGEPDCRSAVKKGAGCIPVDTSSYGLYNYGLCSFLAIGQPEAISS